jgi:hypothetical protein
VCSDGTAQPPVGVTWGYAPRGTRDGATLYRDEPLSRIWGGCAKHEIQGRTLTATCTVYQAGCVVSEVWKLSLQ